MELGIASLSPKGVFFPKRIFGLGDTTKVIGPPRKKSPEEVTRSHQKSPEVTRSHRKLPEVTRKRHQNKSPEKSPEASSARSSAVGMPDLAAVVADPLSGRRMEIHTTEPGIQFYSSNYLNGEWIGKRGIAYRLFRPRLGSD